MAMSDIPEILDIHERTKGINDDWRNFVLAEVNDHVVRVSVLARDFHWHRHLESDETFLVIEGELAIDFEAATRTLKPGQLLNVPKGTMHRTRAIGRSVNLTFEHRGADVAGDT